MSEHGRQGGVRLVAGAIGLTLILSACGTTSTPFGPESTAKSAPLPIEQPLETAAPIPETTPGLPAPATAGMSVKVTDRTKKVQQNDIASVTVKTKPKASCDISVVYKSGPSTASGLDSKKANAKGVVTWKWTVGANTTPGNWPIYITCNLGKKTGSADTTVAVK